MAERKFTPEQLSAIETKNKTLLVSAAAGSGKTATLTERIIRSLVDESNPKDISKMLIVTFTNAAVDELRERITSALKSKLKENPGDARLERQLYMLPNAKISTIDSFCNDILKNNAERFGISPAYRIADPAEAGILAHSVLSTLISSAYNGEIDSVNPKDFEELSGCLVGVKNDSALEEVLSVLYEKSKSHERGVKIFGNFANDMYEYANLSVEETPYGKYAMDAAKEIALHYRKLYEKLCSRITHLASSDCDYIDFLETEKYYFDKILSQTDYENMREVLAEEILPLPRVKKKGVLHEAFGAARDGMKEALEKCYDRYFSYSREEWQLDFLDLNRLIHTLACFMTEFDKLYFEEKKRRGVLEYSDIEMLAYLSLYDEDGNLTELAYAQKEQYSDVYVDEYQDVNSIQNKIFEAVSKADNCFMVGDIKQSIYGFRSARPDIFAKMKDSFPQLKDSHDSNCASIFMSRNFRCDRGIVNFVNDIFHPLFTLIKKSIGYVPEDRLEYGKVDTGTLSLDAAKRTPEIYLFTNADKTDEDDKLGELSLAWVAKKIKYLIENQKLNSGEHVRPSDIAIILRKDGGRAKDYADALESLGVEATVPDRQSFLDSSGIQLVLCLLSAIDNPMRDIYLAGLMMSPLYDFTPDELYKIKKFDKTASLWGSLLQYVKENQDFAKGKEFIKSLNHYRAIAEGVKVDALIMRLYNETGLLALGAKNGFKENLMLLYNYAQKFEASSFEGLYSFISYVNKLIDSGAGFSAPKGSNGDNAVTIITAHKSKGLEFPVVFLVDAATSLYSSRDKQARVAFSDDFGIAMRTRVPEGISLVGSPIYNAIIDRNADKSLEEELRVYYVALTRAREMLYITGAINVKDMKTYLADAKIRKAHISSYTLKQAKSFVDIMLLFESFAKITWNCEKTSCSYDFNEDNGVESCDSATRPSELELPEIYGNGAGNSVLEEENAIEFDRYSAYDDLHLKFDTPSDREDFFEQFEENLSEAEDFLSREEFFKILDKTLAEFNMPPYKSGHTEKKASKQKKEATPDSAPQKELYSALIERLSYKYPNSHLSSLPEKMSISKLYPSVLDGNDENIRLTVDEGEPHGAPQTLNLPEFITGSSDYESAMRGIATHNFLQFFELESFGEGKSQLELERLVSKEFMSQKDAKRVRISEIELFAKSSLLQKMKEAKSLYREFRFNVMLPASLFTKNEERQRAFGGRQILLQGVIDCLIEDAEGNLHLVDYKTDRLTKAELSDRPLAQKKLSEKHRLQLTYYSLAVEKIFSRKPTTASVYSLPLGDTVEVDIKNN